MVSWTGWEERKTSPWEIPQGQRVRKLPLRTIPLVGTQWCPDALTSLPTGSHWRAPQDWFLFIIQVFAQVTLPQRSLP